MLLLFLFGLAVLCQPRPRSVKRKLAPCFFKHGAGADACCLIWPNRGTSYAVRIGEPCGDGGLSATCLLIPYRYRHDVLRLVYCPLVGEFFNQYCPGPDRENVPLYGGGG